MPSWFGTFWKRSMIELRRIAIFAGLGTRSSRQRTWCIETGSTSPRIGGSSRFRSISSSTTPDSPTCDVKAVEETCRTNPVCNTQPADSFHGTEVQHVLRRGLSDAVPVLQEPCRARDGAGYRRTALRPAG